MWGLTEIIVDRYRRPGDYMVPIAALRLFRAILPMWFARPGAPTRMVLALTRRCNLKCTTCRPYRSRTKAELLADEVAAIMRNTPNLAWLDLTGGEIFLRHDIMELFEAVLLNTPRLSVLHFPTNGWFGDKVEAACRLVRSLRPELELIVTVSFDGDEALHDRLRGKKGAFRHAVDTWARLQALPGVQVFAGTTVSMFNERHLEHIRLALENELCGFSVRRWHINLAIESSHFFHNAGVGVGPKRPYDVVRYVLSKRPFPLTSVELMEFVFLTILSSFVQGEEVGFSCQAMHSACFVSADGTLYPCHVFDRPVASLRDVGFDIRAVWESSAALAARQEVLALACGGCFTPCEAYPAIIGSPLSALFHLFRLWTMSSPSV